MQRGLRRLPRRGRGRGGKRLSETLKWELEWGAEYQTLLEIAKSGHTPEALERRPELPPQLAYYLDVFYTLSRGRSISGMGTPGPIPLSEFAAFFEIYDIRSQAQRDWLLRLLSKLDGVYLKHVSEKQASQFSSQPKSPSP